MKQNDFSSELDSVFLPLLPPPQRQYHLFTVVYDAHLLMYSSSFYCISCTISFPFGDFSFAFLQIYRLRRNQFKNKIVLKMNR